MTNLHGVRKYGDGWRPMDATDLRVYLGLLILACVYRSRPMDATDLRAYLGLLILAGVYRSRPMDATDLRVYVGLLILAGVYRSRPMDATDLRAYLGLLILAGVYRSRGEAVRPARLATDKLAAIREVWDLWEARLPALYNPGPDVTVDEQLVPFRGCRPFSQYIPSKPAKYGIKSWVACDAKSNYAWKMQVYTGKPASGGPEKNQGMRVVLVLTTGLTELPPALLESRGRQVLSSRFAFTPTATLVSYLEMKNKNVLLLSTLHTEGHISDHRDKKPAVILEYNCNKGGVDNQDKVVGTYSCRRMTARWPLVVFHNILDVSPHHAFVIWREIKPDWMPRKRNKRSWELGKALVKPLIQRRQHLPCTEAVKVLQSATAAARGQQREGPTPGTAAAPGQVKRKRCQLCPPKKDSKTYTVSSGF
ncbi:piggyBac transposable element-derived protein 4-like [Oncorhynchus kisutch]|uniref:piggyBac transposable element-derived protein 4-like n=1 Tax=Oncorhynchus kisutch TaxID=8019 RepID=UPI0012DD495A|nr:piggyBac transposable element-derived protein 4-like [Oncorhynchus kisutch]